MARVCLWTNDVETHSIYHNRLRDETGERVLKEGMPRLLELYDRHGIKSTFFFTGYIAERFPEVVQMIVPHGHEVASHAYSHEPDEALDRLNYDQQVEAMSRTKKILEDISGEEVVGFRAPALRVNRYTAEALLKTGYLYDSSVASQRFDLFLSFGGREKLKWLRAPRRPYRVHSEGLHIAGDLPLIEVPLSAFLFPYLSTTMRIFPFQTRLIRGLIAIEAARTGKPIVFDTHPNEFIDESDEEFSVHRRTDSFLSHLLGDRIRRRLKLKNLGPAGLPLYETQLTYFRERNFTSMTMASYVSAYHDAQ